MDVCAIIVTRGDHFLTDILDSLPHEWEKILWDNGAGLIRRWRPGPPSNPIIQPVSDLSVYGRYAAIEHTTADLIYVQDDDCVVSDPQELIDAYSIISECAEHGPREWYTEFPDANGWLCRKCFGDDNWHDHVVCNMPQEFRHDFYKDHALVGFGAVFHRDAPCRAFGHLFKSEDCINPSLDSFLSFRLGDKYEFEGDFFRRTCDIVFTGLTPRVLVDVPKENLPWAEAESRMYRQPEHVSERTRMLELVRQVRDA